MAQNVISVLEIIADAASADIVQGILALDVTYGWEESDLENGKTLFKVYNEHPAFLEEIRTAIEAKCPDVSCAIREAPNADWLASWKEFFTPVECGREFVVLPPWLAHLEHRSRREIIINPATAFGTGHHASTRLCLEALGKALAENWINRKGWCLDLGCGTGVLGLAACKIGMDAIALDIDPLAVINARENRELNEITTLEVLKGGIEKVRGEKFDLVMANILARPLIDLAPALIKALKKKAVLILGGILAAQAEEVSGAYSSLGKPIILHEEEWAGLLWHLGE